jgi:hypothetical protein
LTDFQIITYQKATLVFAKLSIISLLMILTASDLHKNFGIGLTGIIVLWGFISEFVAAFQCGSVEPWRFIGPERRCLDLVSAYAPAYLHHY